MSDFKVAIPEAVTHVQPFVQALDDAQRECQEAIRYVQALKERLTQDRMALDEAVSALQNEAHQSEQALTGQAADATANLGRVKSVVEISAEEWEQVFDEEAQALAGASELLPGLAETVRELADKAEAASHGLLEWVATVSQQLELAVASVEKMVSEGLTAHLMAEWTKGTEATVAHLVEFLEKECREKINTKTTDWQHKIEQAHETLGHAFEGIAAHDEAMAQLVTERWEHLLKEQLESTGTEAHNLVDTLGSLSQAVENYEGELQVAGEMVGDHQQQTAESTGRLEHELEQLRDHWATFGVSC